MRNSRTITVLAIVCIVVGCVSPVTKEHLGGGFTALGAGRYDEAIARADEQLTRSPKGEGSAEALYLRGRALEARAKRSDAEAKSDFDAAREVYLDALQARPASDLEPLIRAGLANIAYWQDDYVTAQQQWTAAYGRRQDADPFILYRIGLCQQRLGQFEAADKTFALVQQRFPMTEAADRAKSHTGFRSFTVQLATFASPQGADGAVSELRRQGTNPMRVADPQGRHVVSVGPVMTYAAAEQLKSRHAQKFPDAVIVP